MLEDRLGGKPERGPEAGRLAVGADGNSFPGPWSESAELAQRLTAAQI